MKQIIPFSKEIKFNTRVYEITSISLEHSLRMSDKLEINGEFILSGEYRISDISVNKEPFDYTIPFNIELDDKYKADNVKIDIDDFYYEIVNEQALKINIDVLIDGLELAHEETKVKQELNLELEQKEDYLRDEEVIDLFKETNINVVPLEVKENKAKVSPVEEIKELKPIFDTFDENNETFVTYHVHIVREDDNLDSICLKYNVSKEELSDYNEINEIVVGNKLIVPAYRNAKDK